MRVTTRHELENLHPQLLPTFLHIPLCPPKTEVLGVHLTNHPTSIRRRQHGSTSLIERDGREYIRVLVLRRGSTV